MIIVPFCKCIVITREFKKEDGSVCVELCLTFKKGVVIECPHCGHHMWRDGFTDYVKLILNLEDGSCCDSKPCHLQKLRCSNPNCSSHRVRKDNAGKHKDVLHETHVMLPEHGLPRYEVQAGNFDDFHLIAVQISSYVQKMREAGKLKEYFHLTYKLFLKILGNNPVTKNMLQRYQSNLMHIYDCFFSRGRWSKLLNITEVIKKAGAAIIRSLEIQNSSCSEMNFERRSNPVTSNPPPPISKILLSMCSYKVRTLSKSPKHSLGYIARIICPAGRLLSPGG